MMALRAHPSCSGDSEGETGDESGERDGENDDEEGEDGEGGKPMDDFMALFGGRLSDRWGYGIEARFRGSSQGHNVARGCTGCRRGGSLTR